MTKISTIVLLGLIILKSINATTDYSRQSCEMLADSQFVGFNELYVHSGTLSPNGCRY